MENNKLQTNTNNQVDYFNEGAYKQMLQIANDFYKAGCFGKDVQNPHQLLVKIQAGREMGMGVVEALNSFAIINGAIMIYGPAMIKRIREHDWQLKWLKSSEKEAHVVVSRGDESYESHVTLADVPKTSKIIQYMPREKLRYQAIRNIIKFYIPEVLGSIRYLDTEAEDFVQENANKEQIDISEFKKVEKKPALVEIDADTGEVVEPKPKSPKKKAKLDTGNIDLDGFIGEQLKK